MSSLWLAKLRTVSPTPSVARSGMANLAREGGADGVVLDGENVEDRVTEPLGDAVPRACP
jgi:hypothetical protein